MRKKLLCVLLLAALLLGPVTAQATYERETVRVGFFAFDGYHMMDEKGNRSGYGYDFLRLAARFMDVDFEYIGYERGWNDMLDMLAAGQIDLVTSAQVTPDRLESFAFSKPIGTSSAMLTTRSANRRIVSGDYSTYDGIRIGLLKDNSRNEDLALFAQDNGFTYTTVEFELFTELEAALASGIVDAALTSSLRETQNERVLDLFAAQDFYAVVRPEDTALLDSINYAIDQLNATEGDWKNTLNNRYYDHLEDRDLSFTPQELDLIRQYARGEKTLVITGSPDRSPYTYVENGQLKGIIVDYFDQLADYIGIPYEIAVPSSREEYQQWQKSGPPVVFIDSRIASEKWIEENSFSYSQPYTTMRLAIVTRRDFDGTIDTLAVATAQGEFGIEEGLAPGAKHLEVATRTEAMQAVLDGKADAAVVYLYTAQQFVNQDQRGLLTYTMLEEPTYDYHVGITQNASHELAGIFTKAIYAMPDGTFEQIASQYTSYKAMDTDVLTLIELYPTTAVMLCVGFCLMILLAALLAQRHKAVALEKKRSAQLQAMAEKAEQASRAKGDFLANMSHDIRTPMNAIVGFTELMEREPEKLPEYAQKIKYSSRHMLGLIDDILDMSRIEANQLVLRPEPISLPDQLRQVEAIVRADAQLRKQVFTVTLPPLAHSRVTADGTRVRQVLVNLLSNAVKYTPEGGHVSLSMEELSCEKDGHTRVRFTVADDGCGMTEDFLSHLFEPFARAEDSVTNRVPGTGLGMPITKNIVDRMGGTIEVESAINKGTRFTVTLTLPIADDAGQTQKNPLSGRRFLCAEDNALNAEILTAMLDLHGAACTICSDGEQVVETFNAAAPGEYDAILMDVQMPKLNGLEAARRIRAGVDPIGRTIPIIAMTANASDDDVRRCLDAGMNAHISKPLHVAALAQTIAEFLR